MLPQLPDRKPMFDENGYPTTSTRVWWQAVQREFAAKDDTIAALEARIEALEP